MIMIIICNYTYLYEHIQLSAASRRSAPGPRGRGGPGSTNRNNLLNAPKTELTHCNLNSLHLSNMMSGVCVRGGPREGQARSGPRRSFIWICVLLIL